jgi:hypothetical protein
MQQCSKAQKSVLKEDNNNKTNLPRVLILVVRILFVLLIAIDIPVQRSFAHHILEEIQVEGRPMRLPVNDGLCMIKLL